MAYQGSRAELAQELAENYYRYAEGLDSKNWEMVRSCFADEVYLDYGAVLDSDAGPDVPRKADDWIKVLQGVINGFDITRHLMSNPRLDLSGEEVSCRIYLTADHVIFPEPGVNLVGPENVATVTGEYTNAYVHTAQGWKICRSKLAVDYSSGNAGLFAVAMERAAAVNSRN